jgi:hypothetical protein
MALTWRRRGLSGLGEGTKSTLVSRLTKTRETTGTTIEEGSTNVYADLGYADAAAKIVVGPCGGAPARSNCTFA